MKLTIALWIILSMGWCCFIGILMLYASMYGPLQAEQYINGLRDCAAGIMVVTLICLPFAAGATVLKLGRGAR